MGPGVTMAVVGAILAFAVRVEPSGIDLQVVGLILMVAGGLLIWHDRRESTHERVITRVEQPPPPGGARVTGRTVRESIRDRERD
jgi:hypothetical protein